MSTQPQQHTFEASGTGERLDQVIAAQLETYFTRSQVQALIKAGHVTVDGKPGKSGLKVKGGEAIIVDVPPPPEATELTVAPEPIPLDVVFEDLDFAVINKPAGMVVHPGAGNPDHTLVNAILSRYPEISEMHYAPQRRGIVHRLDKNTSGLILIARNSKALQTLITQFQKRTVEKTYIALAEKAPRTPTGRIDAPIARDPAQRKRMIVIRSGRPSVTEFRTLESFTDGSALVELHPFTGRTHQIRVHMAFIGAPLVGDTTYGFRKGRRGTGRQFLHAARLCFDHPRTGERLCFEAPLAPDLEAYLNVLRQGNL
ncbi:MAG TPA: RluA family pseudouridine synthase, partial [Candidatus Limnocylindrales bacterium]|nr:RluA family pseudouridine synthase [Candidatus Limnocylindrales bacterium]